MSSTPLLVERLAQRQADARARAEALRARLPEARDYLRGLGATRVLLFGSLATSADPHAGTDVDLCVEGLDESGVGEACLELERRLGIHVDVVAWERASPRLRAAIARDGRELLP